MSGALLDTSLLIAAGAAADELPPVAAVSVITFGELRAGVLLARDAVVRNQREQRFEAVRAAFAPLPVDEAVAEHYGDLRALARSQRRIAKATDLLIIATAAATARTLYTLDSRQAEFARAARVPVEVPSATA